MADPASGIITLITASLVVIREMKKFIQETREVDSELRRRATQLDSLEQYVLAVEKQCNGGLGLGEDVPRLINDSLLSLKPKLEELQNIVRDQASRGSDTLYRRLKTQIHMRLSQRDVNNAMQELVHYQSVMALSVNLGILQLAMNIDRRTSDASPISPFLPTDLPLPNAVPSPKNRTLSSDSTAYDPSVTVGRHLSVATQSSFLSQQSSGSSVLQTPSDGRASLSLGSPVSEEKNDIALDIHYYINQAGDSQSRLRAVRKVLGDRSDSEQLVEKRDRYGRTPLFTAIKTGDLQLVRTLVLEFKADINATDNRPCSVLEYALSLPKKRDVLVEFLIEQGVDEKKIASNEHRVALEEIKGSMKFRKEQAEKNMKKRAESKSKQKPSRVLNFRSKRRLPT